MRHNLFRFSGRQIERAAVLLQKYPTGTHTGIIYYNEGSKRLKLLHAVVSQGSFVIIETIDWAGKQPHVLFNSMDDDASINLASLCEVMSNRYRDGGSEHMYGFFRDRSAYIDGSGELFLGTSAGVSCASFVLIVLDRCGIELVTSGNDWPHRPHADDIRHAELLNWMEANGAEVEHLKKVIDQLPCPRVAPEEIAGACMAHAFPVSQDYAQRAAKWLLAVIDASFQNRVTEGPQIE